MITIKYKTYHSCDCGDYEEGCVRCFKKDMVKIIEEILLNRRKQINIAFEGKDERMMAHMHTFVNKFEEELKARIEGK